MTTRLIKIYGLSGQKYLSIHKQNKPNKLRNYEKEDRIDVLYQLNVLKYHSKGRLKND